MEEAGNKNKCAPLAPELLVLDGVNYAGPLWIVRPSFTVVKPIEFYVQPAENNPADLLVSPLWRDTDGGNTHAHLSIDHATNADNNNKNNHRISLAGHLTPGLYHAALSINSDKNNNAKNVIPIKVRIRAHWLWIALFLLLGLVSLGVGQYLAGEQSLLEKRKEIKQLRREFNELRERNPAATPKYELISSIDSNFNSALARLAQPRPFGIKDSRIETAEYYKLAAQAGIQEVRNSLAGKMPGEVEVENMQLRWSNLNKRVDAIEKLLLKDQSTSAAINPIARAGEHLERSMDQRFIAPLIKTIRAGLSIEVERALLVYSAGQIDRSRRLSMQVESWLQRAAMQLESNFNMIIVWRATFYSIQSLALRVSDALKDPMFLETPELQLQYQKAISIIDTTPTHEGFRDAHSLLQETLTGITRVRAQKLINDLEKASAQVEEDNNLSKIEQIISSGPKDPSPEQKRASRLRVIDEWDDIIKKYRSPERRALAQDILTSLRPMIAADDLSTMEQSLEILFTSWNDDAEQRDEEARASLLAPYCSQEKSEIEETIAFTYVASTQLQPHPGVADTEELLDRIQLQLNQVPLDGTCLYAMVEISAALSAVSNRVFSTGLMLSNISPEDRIDAAKRSTIDEIILLAEQLKKEPWPILVSSRTPQDERTSDRDLVLAIENLHASWGSGTVLRIDFGDGSVPFTTNAEKVRQAGVVTYRYARSGLYAVHVQAKVEEQSANLLGSGSLELTIDPSPVNAASRLAAMFFNMRFLIALLVAILIQIWRVNSERQFGSQSRNYVEAFAIGAGSNAGIEGVVSLLQSVSV